MLTLELGETVCAGETAWDLDRQSLGFSKLGNSAPSLAGLFVCW